MENDIDNKPMTTKDIREVLIPAMEGVFATKKDLEQFATKEDANEVKRDINEVKFELQTFKTEVRENFVTKKEFTEFKDKSYTYFDRILKDLEILKIEKEMGYHQKQKERKLWTIMIKAMQEHNILSAEQMKTIKDLEVF